jgi:hypothetical protein
MPCKATKTRCLMNQRKSKFAPKRALSLEEFMPDRLDFELLSGRAQNTPETALMLRENAKRLREAVQKFPPDCRLVLTQHNPLLARLVLFSNKLSLSIRQQMDRIGLGQQTQGGWKPS